MSSDLGVVLAWCNAPRAAVDAGREAGHPRRDGLSARLRAVWWPCRRPSMGRQMHRKCMRNELLNLSTIVSTTAWRQRNYIGTYKRSICRSMHQHVHLSTLDMEGGHHPLLIHFAQEYHRRRRGQHGVPYFVIRRPSSYASKRNLVLL